MAIRNVNIPSARLLHHHACRPPGGQALPGRRQAHDDARRGPQGDAAHVRARAHGVHVGAQGRLPEPGLPHFLQGGRQDRVAVARHPPAQRRRYLQRHHRDPQGVQGQDGGGHGRGVHAYQAGRQEGRPA